MAPTTTASGSAEALLGVPRPVRTRRPLGAWRRLRGIGWEVGTGATILIALAGFALAAPLIGDPYQIDANGLSETGRPLSVGAAGHLLGTDALGRDMLARLAEAGRSTLLIAVLTNILSVGVGGFVGLVAGYFRGATEVVLMRLTDIFLSVPTVISGLALASVIGTGLLGIVAVVTTLYWAWTARMVYGETLALRNRGFVEAAKAQGVGSLTIIRRHVLPHLASLIMIIAALNGAAVVAIGSGLSYLGAGIQPPTPEWGNMLDEGQLAIGYAPHLIVEPLIFIVATILAFVMIADGLARIGSARRKSWLDI